MFGALVVTSNEAVVRWASVPIELGGGNRFVPLVIGPSGVPAVTDFARAAADPELAVLSALSHGRSDDVDRALQIAVAAMTASAALDPDRSVLYFDLVYASLSEAARKALQAMDPAKYEFQSDFARRFLAEGEAKGRAEGRAEGEARVLLKLLALKFGTPSDVVTLRIQTASLEELELWIDRVLNSVSIDDVLR